MSFSYANLIDDLARVAREENFAVYQPAHRLDELFHDCFIILGHFGDKRRALLRIFCLNEATAAVDTDAPNDIRILQFMSVLPARLPEGLFNDARGLIERINKVLPLGAFGCSGEDSAIYFKYAHVITPETTQPEFFGHLLSTIHAYFEMFVPLLFAVAEESITVAEAIQKLHDQYELGDVSVLPFPYFPSQSIKSQT